MNSTEMYLMTALLICALVGNSAEAKRNYHHMLGKRQHWINTRGYGHVFGKRGDDAAQRHYHPYIDTNDLRIDESDTLESKEDDKGFDDQLHNPPSLAINWPEQMDTLFVPSENDLAESQRLDGYDETPWSSMGDQRRGNNRDGSESVNRDSQILEQLLRPSSPDERSKLIDRINELMRSSAH